MNKYTDSLDITKKQYFSILSPEFPSWLHDYIETPEMQRLSGISMLCGTDYSKLFNYKSSNNTLDHSIGVALIVWNFTKDKKQTLAGLFHDIATPVFKHCIDFMNGDTEHQESTEEMTEEIIRNSKTIMELLNKDDIKVEEVCDYHIYPIADNDSPRLSADRFEYTFSNAMYLYGVWNLQDIKRYYSDISILKNEDNVEELGFNTLQICKDYFKDILPIFANYDSDKNRTVMQFIADTIKSLHVKGLITIKDLYTKSEQEIIDYILSCEDQYIIDSFKKFLNTTQLYAGETPNNSHYCISIKAKRRYIVPLVKFKNQHIRINNVDNDSSRLLIDFKNIKRSTYTGFYFDFKPYQYQ